MTLNLSEMIKKSIKSNYLVDEYQKLAKEYNSLVDSACQERK